MSAAVMTGSGRHTQGRPGGRLPGEPECLQGGEGRAAEAWQVAELGHRRAAAATALGGRPTWECALWHLQPESTWFREDRTSGNVSIESTPLRSRCGPRPEEHRHWLEPGQTTELPLKHTGFTISGPRPGLHLQALAWPALAWGSLF